MKIITNCCRRHSLSFYLENTIQEYIKKVMDGEYDMSIYSIGYPMDNPNVTQEIQLFEKIHDILTHVINGNKIKRGNANYFIFSLDCYEILLFFITIWAIINIVHSLMLSHGRTKISFRAICLKLLRNAFDLITSHFGNVNCHSFHRTLQLSVFICITLLVAVYTSSFSNESIFINSVKAYDTYKSLYNDPPEMIMTNFQDIHLIDEGKLNRPGQVPYLQKMRSIYSTGTQMDNKEKNVAAVRSEGEHFLKHG